MNIATSSLRVHDIIFVADYNIYWDYFIENISFLHNFISCDGFRDYFFVQAASLSLHTI